MAEILGIASAAIGLLPVALDVVKGFQTLKRGLRAAKACVKELDRLDLDLRTQERLFVNECELILHKASPDSRDPRRMTQDLDHPLWQDVTLESRIQECLSRSYEQCIEIIKSMRLLLRMLESEIDLFAVVRRERVAHESMRTAFRRLRVSLTIGFDISPFEHKLGQIREYNASISSIRSQLDSFQKLKSDRAQIDVTVSSKALLPPWIPVVNEMSRDAYAALTSAFSCQENDHIDHFAALRTDEKTQNREDARFKLAIAYCRDTKLQDQKLLRFSLQSCHPLSDGASEGGNQIGKAHKKENLTGSPFTEDSTISKTARPGDVVNLSAIQNTCAYLESTLNQPPSNSHAKHLAYLYKHPSCRYSFYVTIDQSLLPQRAIAQTKTLQSFLTEDRNMSLSITDQFKLAVKLVFMVLQFHSTPWLRDFWKTSDLLLDTSQTQYAESHELLLCSRLFSQIHDDLQLEFGASLWDRKGKIVQDSQSSQRPYYDINNRPLFSLGVALLEIGHWTPLSQMRMDNDLDEISTALRASQQRTVLGKSYGDVVRRCMQCHFGNGNDLSRAELQNAIYSSVICPLQDLVKKLDSLEI